MNRNQYRSIIQKTAKATKLGWGGGWGLWQIDFSPGQKWVRNRNTESDSFAPFTAPTGTVIVITGVGKGQVSFYMENDPSKKTWKAFSAEFIKYYERA